MKKLCQNILAFLMVCTLACSVGLVSHAAGTTTMYLSSNSPKVGDSLKLTVTGSESSTITVKYNATILNFVSCDAAGYSTSGNSIVFKGKTGNIDFKVAQSGNANIIISSDTLAGCSTQISVAEAQATVTEAPAEETAPETEVAVPEDATSEVNTVADSDKIGSAEHYVIVMTPDVFFSDSLVETAYSNGVGTYVLYQFAGVSSEFYYVYGENESGIVGWYVFDSATEQIYRADLAVLSMVGDDSSVSDEPSDVSEYIEYVKDYCEENSRNIITILILLIAVIIVIIINIRVFKKNSSEEDDDGSDIFGDLDQPKKESLLSKAEKETSENKNDTESDSEIPVLDMSVVNEVLSEESQKDDSNKESIIKDDVKKVTASSGSREINLMDLNNL